MIFLVQCIGSLSYAFFMSSGPAWYVSYFYGTI